MIKRYEVFLTHLNTGVEAGIEKADNGRLFLASEVIELLKEARGFANHKTDCKSKVYRFEYMKKKYCTCGLGKTLTNLNQTIGGE